MTASSTVQTSIFALGSGASLVLADRWMMRPTSFAASPVAVGNQALVHHDGVGAAVGNGVNRLLHVNETRDRSYGDPVVHGDNDRLSRISVNDAL